MKLKVIFHEKGCRGGKCPTIYKTETGDFIFQGLEVEKSHKTGIPENESMVRIPKEFIEAFIQKYKDSKK